VGPSAARWLATAAAAWLQQQQQGLLVVLLLWVLAGASAPAVSAQVSSPCWRVFSSSSKGTMLGQWVVLLAASSSSNSSSSTMVGILVLLEKPYWTGCGGYLGTGPVLTVGKSHMCYCTALRSCI
jgi:hypothetical protein